jgi:hypothetical protein
MRTDKGRAPGGRARLRPSRREEATVLAFGSSRATARAEPRPTGLGARPRRWDMRRPDARAYRCLLGFLKNSS